MTATYSYADGTISVVNASAVVAGSGTAWTTQVKAGDTVRVPISLGESPSTWRYETIGVVGSVDSDAQITLQDAWLGDDLSGASYRIVKGIAWLSGAAPVEQMVELMNRLAGLGLNGTGAGTPDPDEGDENEQRYDSTNGILYQKIAGSWEVVASAFAADAWGYTLGSPNDRDEYDARAKDFLFGSIDEGGFYIKLSAAGGDWSELLSLKGADGSDGADGADGISGYQFTFDSATTEADPGAGKFRLNNAALASVTEAYVDDTALIPSADVSAIIAGWDNSTSTVLGLLTLAGTDDPTDTAMFRVTAVAPQSGYTKLSLTYVGHTGAFVNGEDYAFQFAQTGDKGDTGSTGATGAAGSDGSDGADGADGADGTDPGYLLTWDTGTADADPGAGKIRANDADLSSATILYVSKTNRAGSDIAARLLELGSATKDAADAIILTKSADETQASFEVSSVADATGYVKVTVANHAGATAFSAADAVSLQREIAGVDGVDGSGSVASVNGIGPDGGGDVTITAAEITGEDPGESPSPTTVQDILNNFRALLNVLAGSSGVVSFNGRQGPVLPASGDYDSDEVDNASVVSGASVSDALETLAVAITALVTGVSSVAGKTGAVELDGGDITVTDYDNSPSVMTLQELLDTLRAIFALALRSDVEDQAITGGGRIATKDLGNLSGNTITPDPGDRAVQKITNNGSGTIAPGTNYGRYELEIINTTGAASPTTSGWDDVAGDSIGTSTTAKYRCSCSVSAEFSSMIIREVAS